MSDNYTDFGYEKVRREDKQRKVGAVFDSVATRYDLMNDLMSLGVHRFWKRFTIEQSDVRPGQRVLDLAGGTGDLAERFSPLLGRSGQVIVSDINASMLATGRRRLLDRGVAGNLHFVQANAENLPFSDREFDIVSIGFGLRNVTDKSAALKEMLRVLKPGGRALILEFSKPVAPGLKPLYDFYSFKVLPLLGRVVADDADSYRYLAESIRMHPGQDDLKALMTEAGFEDTEYFNLSGGIVALHRGYRF